MQDEFHQMVDVELVLLDIVSAGKLNRIFKENGATLSYDVYSFEKQDQSFDWQSDSYIYCRLFLNNDEVDAQDSVDKLILSYPLATIGSEYIPIFVDKVRKLADALGGSLYLDSKPISDTNLTEYFDSCVTSLMENFGEEPGSKSLAILIESNY